MRNSMFFYLFCNIFTGIIHTFLILIYYNIYLLIGMLILQAYFLFKQMEILKK